MPKSQNFLPRILAIAIMLPLWQSCHRTAPVWFTAMEKARRSCADGDFTQSDNWVQKALADANVSNKGIPASYDERAPYSPSSLSGELATLAEYYSWWGKYGKAEAYFKQAIAVSSIDNRLGYLEALADFYTMRGKYKEAEALYEDCLDLAKAKYSHTDKVSRFLLKLADSYLAQNDFAEAEARYQKNIEAVESEDPDINKYDRANALIALGRCRLKSGKLPEARMNFEQALELDTKELKESFLSVITSYLGDVSVAAGDDGKAEDFYKKSLGKNDYSFAPETETTTRQHYAALLRRHDKVAQAQVIEEKEKKLKPLTASPSDIKARFRPFLPALYQ
jgi:tetratricopeptide (TPR) repeat protein